MNVDNLENGKNDEKTSKRQRPTNTLRGANNTLLCRRQIMSYLRAAISTIQTNLTWITAFSSSVTLLFTYAIFPDSVYGLWKWNSITAELGLM